MFLKRLFDFTASFFGMIILLPVFLVIVMLIKIKMSPGPILFKQIRIGQHGKKFTLIKFRTMTINHSGSSISVNGENRITPLGRIMRRYKLDELAGLWNVIKGEMSLVGPRPDVPGYADKLRGEERKILELRPGLTGPASMKYKNEEEILAAQNDPLKYNDEIIWPDKVRINLEYLKRHNFWLDLKITIFTVFGKKLNEPWL